MTSALLIIRLEQIRAHLDTEHKHLIDQVYEALTSGDTPPASPGPDTASSRQAWPNDVAQLHPLNAWNDNVIPLHRYSTKVGV